MAWLVASLVGCGGGGKIKDVAFVAGGVVGTGTVTFTTKLEGKAHVEHSLDGKEWLSTPAADAAKGKIEVRGLQVAQDVQIKVVVETDKKTVESEEITAEIDAPPTGTPAFTLNGYDPGGACMDGGYVLLSTIAPSKSGIGILNRDGKYVWAVAADSSKAQIGRVRPGRDGQSVLWNIADSAHIDDIAVVYRLNLDGSGKTETRTLNGHHDFVELPDGQTFAWPGYQFVDLDLPDLGTTDPDPVVAEAVYEIAEGTADAEAATLVWDMLSDADWPYGIYNSGPEMEACPTVPDAPRGFIPGYCEFGHVNSLAYLEEDDAYLVMFRWLDALVKVDRGTGKVLWVFGGDHDEFSGDDDTRFVHGHFSDAWHDGDGLLHVLIVDNHDADPGEEDNDSRYTEFVLDESAKTFERTWVFQSEKFELLLGDIRRIPIDGCDNLLISFSSQGRVVEMTRDGEIVWDIGLQLGNVTSRVQFLPDLYDLSGTAYP